MTSWLWAVPVFGLIILVHELGHFLAAKSFGVRIYEFAIGLGPTLAAVRRGETRYTLRLFLLMGGFVRWAGDEGDLDDPQGFTAKPVWQRMLIIFAGPAMNFILAVALLAALFGWRGQPVTLSYVAGVLPGSPAAVAGIAAGDRVVAIDGQPIESFAELAEAVRESGGRTLTFTVERQGEQLTIPVEPRLDADGQYRVGIMPDPARVAYRRMGWGEALGQGAAVTLQVTGGILRAVGDMITGRQAPQLSGPVGIVQTVAEASRQGLDTLVSLAAVLSINIGLFNLFPIPALDGSRLVFLSLEALRGQRLNPERENLAHFVGFLLLLGLMAALTYKELMALF
ncbi:MAG: RIP metalloprotease RseP [Bacillota bacterium]